jgi:hypothetical protein
MFFAIICPDGMCIIIILTTATTKTTAAET